MSIQLTRWQLASLLMAHGTPTLTLPDGRQGIVSAVEREDASGRSFNVTVLVPSALSTGAGKGSARLLHPMSVYVRTLD